VEQEILRVVTSRVVHCCAIKKNIIGALLMYSSQYCRSRD